MSRVALHTLGTMELCRFAETEVAANPKEAEYALVMALVDRLREAQSLQVQRHPGNRVARHYTRKGEAT